MARTLAIRPMPMSSQRLGRWREQARAWGWPGLLGALCLLGAAALAFGWTPRLRQQTAVFSDAALVADSRAARLSETRRSSASQLPPSERFLAGFGPLATRQDRVGALLALAANHHLEPQQTEFQQSREGPPGLVRLRIAMPLSGPYAQLRGFIDEAQERDPSLSLDGLRLRRSSPQSANVAADVRWSLYLRDDPARAMPNAMAASATR